MLARTRSPTCMSVGKLVSLIYPRFNFQWYAISTSDATYPIRLAPAIALCNDIVEVVCLIVIDICSLSLVHEWLLTRTGVHPIGAICAISVCRKGRDVQRRTRKSGIILRPGRVRIVQTEKTISFRIWQRGLENTGEHAAFLLVNNSNTYKARHYFPVHRCHLKDRSNNSRRNLSTEM